MNEPLEQLSPTEVLEREITSHQLNMAWHQDRINELHAAIIKLKGGQ